MGRKTKLEKLRDDLKYIDYHIVDSINWREKTVLSIEMEKRKMGKPIVNMALEKERINSAVETAKKMGMDEGSQKLVKKIFTALITHCRKQEIKQRKNAGGK